MRVFKEWEAIANIALKKLDISNSKPSLLSSSNLILLGR